MKVVYKYPFETRSDLSLMLPEGFQILHLEVQQGYGPCLWVLCDSDAKKKEVHFRVFGTGHGIKDEHIVYVGTWLDGNYAWHLFKERE